jgi:hypothetical protein
MSFKPDYGLHLHREGLSRDVDITMYGFRLFILSVLGLGQFSTCAEMNHDGEYHAVSLDFDLGQLLQILESAPVEVLAQLLRAVGGPRNSPRQRLVSASTKAPDQRMDRPWDKTFQLA